MTNQLSSANLLLDIKASIIKATPGIVKGLIILLVFGCIAWVLRRVVRHAAGRASDERRDIVLLLGRTAWVTVMIVGGIMALNNMGVNVATLITGLGLTGFALGFALRDALSNMLAGVLIIMYQPFRRGDRINMAGFEGIVTAIDLRYTTLMVETKTVLIPNTTAFNSVISVVQRAAH